MDNYSRINGIIDEIQNLLEGFLLSGLGIVRDTSLKDMERLSKACSQLGFQYAEKLLLRLEYILQIQRHSFKSNSGEAVQCCCELGAYLDAISSKIKLKIVQENIGNIVR